MLLLLVACTENQVVPRESQPSTHDSEVEDSPVDSPADSPVDSEAPVLEPDIVLTPRSYGWPSLADVCPAQDKSLVVYNGGDADLLLLEVEEIELGSAHLAIALDDEEVFVASNDDQTLYVLDKTGSVVEMTSLVDVQVLDLDLDEDHVYAALFDLGSSYPYEGRVAVLDRATLEEVASLTFEGYPDVYTGNTTMAHYPQAVHVEGSTRWVAVTNEDLLFQVDLSTFGVTDTHAASSRPRSLASDRDHVYLANKHGASLYQFDAGGLVDSSTMDEYLTNVAADDEQLWVVRQQGGMARLESDGLGLLDDFGHYGQSWSSDVHISGDTTDFEYLNRHLRD